MAGYSPLKITGNESGLIQSRENFLLPDDAYPILQNAYVWRERIKRKKGCLLIGRLQRNFTSQSIGNIGWAFAGIWGINLFSLLTPAITEPNASLVPGSVIVTIGAPINNVLTDAGNGTMTVSGAGTTINSVTINYATGVIEVTTNAAGAASAATATMSYYPSLPVMGINTQELLDSEIDQTVIFDQKYAYVFNPTINSFQEFIPGVTWNAAALDVTSTDFFWSTNYWVSSTPIFSTSNVKLFWVTNNSGHSGATADPPRITDGTTWVDFTSGTWNKIDATNFLWNFLSMLPFRGRMVTFNTWEGDSAVGALNYRQRIRWSTIGNPFIAYTAGPPAAGSWRSDIRGQGGYLDIPTAEDIVAVGFVRDNLVIYCEKSTWQLRYTGRSIAPFQIEKVNSELGIESPYSAVQFDTSLIGIGGRGIIECDSYKAEKIDIKIPDFVFNFNIKNNGPFRIQGIRDFENRLAYWTIPLASAYDPLLVNPSTGLANFIFPNIRLVYNYENDSWATFSDSYTALGTYQTQSFRTWINTPQPWIECAFSWIDQPQADYVLIGGNQQGFVEQLDTLSYNDVSLSITGITGNTTTATTITSPNHNLTTNTVIGISGVAGPNFTDLNGGVFAIFVIDQNNFNLFTYNSSTGFFENPQLDTPGTYFGGGLINIRDNFNITSKKFNFLDEGQSIQLGYIDLLAEATASSSPGAITLNVYLDYDDVNASNVLPNNQIDDGNSPVISDTFFNSIIPTTPSNTAVASEGTKFWQRVFCSTRANFITLQYTLSNAQMAGQEQQQPVQIDAQVLWIRKGGRMTQT